MLSIFAFNSLFILRRALSLLTFFFNVGDEGVNSQVIVLENVHVETTAKLHCGCRVCYGVLARVMNCPYPFLCTLSVFFPNGHAYVKLP